MASTIQFRPGGSIYFSINGNSLWSSEQNPLVCSSRVCCSCCCTSVSLVRMNPSYGYSIFGMRQSSLIQLSLNRKQVLCSYDPCFHTRLSTYDTSGSCCSDKFFFRREKSENIRKERLRKKFVLEGRAERRNDKFIDEEEDVLSLLTDDVDEKYLLVASEARRAKKNIAKEIKHTKFSNKRRSISRESVLLLISKVGDTKSKEKIQRKQENPSLVREETKKRKDLSKQEMRDDESSCSSYHSFSSSGDYESDSEIEHREKEYLKDSSCDHERNSRSSKMVIQEVKEQDIHEDHREEHDIGMTKKNFSSGKESSFVGSDFRKKSEKKLTDKSVEEMESRKKTSQKESMILVEQKHYGKSFDNNVSGDDVKEKSSWCMKLDEEEKQQHKQANDAVSMEPTRLKYKNHVDRQGTHYMGIKNSCGSKENMYNGKGNLTAKISCSSQEIVRKSLSVVGKSTRRELNQSSIQVAEVSKTQEIDLRKTSISNQSFEISANGEDNYTISLSSENDGKKLQQRLEQVAGLVLSGGVSKPPSKIESRSVLKQSHQILNQEENVTLAYGCIVDSEKLHSRGHAKITKSDHSVAGSDEVTKLSITLSTTEDVKDPAKGNIQDIKANSVEILLEDQNFQQTVVPLASGNSQLKEHYSKDDDWFSRVEGPLDKTWKVYEPSVNGQQKEVNQDDETKASTEMVKRTGRSLWDIISDIFLLRWSPRSDSHHSGRKTAGRSPQTQSTGSEPCFSRNEAEENDEANKGKGWSTDQELLQSRRKEILYFQVEERASSSTSAGHLKLEGLQATTVSPAIITPTSAEEISARSSSVTPCMAIIEPLTHSPVLQPERSLVNQGSLEAGEGIVSDDGILKLNTGSMDYAESTIFEGKLRRGKLQRKDQIQREKFAEWEEAYRVETEQRKIDATFMREALLEAQKAADNWEVPVGAVLVHNGRIIARGYNLVEELRDPTAHAELICITQASDILRTWRLSETCLYITLEPCPMCAGAILQARIDTVVWGAPNKLLGADGSWIRLFPSGDGENELEQSGKPRDPVHPFHPKISIRRGVLASECADTMQRFFKLRRNKKIVKGEQISCLSIIPFRPSIFLSRIHQTFTMLFWW